MVTYANGVPTYAVKIKDFQNKMKTWPFGKKTISEVFSVDGVDLCLIIYPNGDGKKNEGNVSVFLENKSFETIRVQYVFKMKDVEMSLTKDNLKPDSASAWGVASLYCHKGVTEVGTDEKTEIKLTVKSVKKEVSNVALLSSIGTEIQRGNDQLETNIQSSINRSTNELKRKYESIENKVDEGSSNFEKRIANLESRLEAATESIKMKIEDSTTKNNNVAKPRCPICLDEMSPNTKIAQCISGHLLCWSCKEKMEDKECAFCEEPVNGRAFGMEAYLRTIFG